MRKLERKGGIRTQGDLVARLLIDCWGRDGARVGDGSSVDGGRISHWGQMGRVMNKRDDNDGVDVNVWTG